jgi:hypothetical protein
MATAAHTENAWRMKPMPNHSTSRIAAAAGGLVTAMDGRSDSTGGPGGVSPLPE